jgi:fluoride exporter
VSVAAWIGFLAAAAIGAPARFLVDGWIEDRVGDDFPWGTLVVNLTGCLALGVLTGLARSHGLGATPRTIIGTGGLGAYTTFSTFTFETVRLVEEGELGFALGNVAASVVIGLAAAAIGIALVSF